MANKVTTEWEDIHVKLGNYIAPEHEETGEELAKIALDAYQKYDPMENKTLDELKEMEEDDDEDEVLKKYKEKRMKELKEFASKPHFGKLFEWRKQDYIAEVTNAPKDVYVVWLLYQTYVEASNILMKIFENLAKKYVLVKFMKIVASNCIEGYGDNDVPGVIVYLNGKLLKQFIPAVYFFGGSKHLSWKKVEWILSSIKVLKTDWEEDPFEENDEDAYRSKIKKNYKYNDDDSEEEDEKDDREFSWKINKK